MKIMLKIVDWH